MAKSNKLRVYRRVRKPKAEKVVTGKPDAEKLACPVWEGAVGNVLQGNALAAYFTPAAK